MGVGASAFANDHFSLASETAYRMRLDGKTWVEIGAVLMPSIVGEIVVRSNRVEFRPSRAEATRLSRNGDRPPRVLAMKPKPRVATIPISEARKIDARNVFKSRAEGKSWGDISIDMGISEGKARSLFTQYTGMKDYELKGDDLKTAFRKSGGRSRVASRR